MHNDLIVSIISERNTTATSPSPYTLNDTTKRPSVDSLLDELQLAHTAGGSASPIYAVPNNG